MNQYLKASNNPLDDINDVAYANQPIENRMYKGGYEDHFEMLPILSDNDPLLQLKQIQTKAVMDDLAVKLNRDPWTESLQPLEGGFNRTILGMEKPEATIVDDHICLKEGSEIVLARWGNEKTSPVHGHANGYLYEQLIFGTMRVNTYRIIDPVKRIARPVETKIYKGFENIAEKYTPTQAHERSSLVHNFTSIGYSASLHYLPEHTRDGRDNKFEVQYFDQVFDPFYFDQHLKQLNAQQGIEQLKIGDVALVRSANVPDYGDHFIVITGKPIMKEHGLRPQDVAIHAPYAARKLKYYNPIMGLTLLKLDDWYKNQFHDFHGITIDGDKIIFPTA